MPSATFTMRGGSIIGNTVVGSGSSSLGGGVYVSAWSTFTMNDSIIGGNTASQYGGGVYLENNANFNKTRGTIYGYDEDDIINSNMVVDISGNILSGRGHAASFPATSANRRETTAGPDVSSGSGFWE